MTKKIIALISAAMFSLVLLAAAGAQTMDQTAIEQALSAMQGGTQNLSGSLTGTAPTTAPQQPTVNQLTTAPSGQASGAQTSSGQTAAAVQAPAQTIQPSSIEQMFATMASSLGTSAQNLTQFGYSLFGNPTAPSLAAIGDDYTLGPGDGLVLYLWGDPVDIRELSSSYVLTVDRNGAIFLPPVGQVSVWGQNLGTVKETLKSMLDRRYKKLEMNLTLSTLRQFPVFVSGYAGNPGTVLANGADTVFTVLSRAGGILKTGSLRSVVLTRQGKGGAAERVDLDFYASLLEGKSIDLRVREGDSIFIPGIGPVVALSGELRRPGIYEIKSEASIGQVLALAGNALPSARSGNVSLLRFEAAGKVLRTGDIADKAFAGLTVSDGDFVYFGRVSDLLLGQAQISGTVKYPGRYDVGTFKTLRSLLLKAQPLPETNLFYGRLYRIDQSGRDKSFAFSPRDVLASAGDVPLSEFDKVVLYRYDDTTIDPDFDRFADTVVISGPVKYPGFYLYKEGARLSDLLANNALLLDANHFYAELTRRGSGGKPEYHTFSPDSVLAGKTDLALARYDTIRFVARDGQATDHDFDKFPNAVTVTGNVARPDVYALTEGMKLSSIVTKDQMLLDTNLNYAEITRLQPDGKNEYVTFRPSEVLSGVWDFELASRDAVNFVKVGYAPEKPDFDRFGDAVEVKGPVQFWGMYAWREGMSLSALLKLAKPKLETNQFYAEIVRAGENGRSEYLTFSPRDVTSGAYDMALKAKDIVRLYTNMPVGGVSGAALTSTVAAPGTAAQVTAPTGAPASATVPSAAVSGAQNASVPVQAPLQAATGTTEASGSVTVPSAGAGTANAAPSAAVPSAATGPSPAAQGAVPATTTTAPASANTQPMGIASGTVANDQAGNTQPAPLATRMPTPATIPVATTTQPAASGTASKLAQTAVPTTPAVSYGPPDTEKDLFNDVVTVSGAVRYTGPYALTPGLKLSSIVTKDQMLLDTNLNYGELTRQRPDGKNEYLTFRPSEVLSGVWDLELEPRDVVNFVKVGYAPEKPDFDRFGDAVEVKGPVQFGGMYAWKEGVSLSALLKLAKPLLETNQFYAEVVRIGKDGRSEYLTFAPREVASGAFDMALKAKDIVRLYTEATETAVSASGAETIDVNNPHLRDVKEYVSVVGEIRYQGPYARTPGLMLSSVLIPEQILDTTNLDYAELTRLNADGKAEYRTFSPKDVLGGTYDLPLQAKDSIRFVAKTAFGAAGSAPELNKYSAIVQLKGNVARPDVYALTPGLRLSSVLTADQMLLDTNLNYGEITRLKADGKNEYLTFRPGEVLDGSFDLDLGPRDVISLVKVGYVAPAADAERFGQAVTVEGPVEFAGSYAWKKGMGLKELLSLAKPLLETNQVYAEIVRPLGGGKNEYVTFAPREVERGDYDTALKVRDRIRLYSTATAKTTTVKQGVEAGTEVSEGGSAQATAVAGGATVSPGTTSQGGGPGVVPGTQETVPVEVPAASQAPATAPVLGSAATITPDLGLFLEVVTVSGTIRYQGPYARTPSLKLSSVVTADQILEETNLEYAELTRLKADGTPEYHTFAPKNVLEGKYDLALKAKDAIRFVAKTAFGGAGEQPNLEKFSDLVQLTGNVARPEVYALRPGMKLSSVLTADQMLLDTNLNYGEITRLRSDGKNEYLTFRPGEVLSGGYDVELGPRDVIRLVKVGYAPEKPDFDRFGDAVEVKGPVQFGGMYAWKEGVSLSALLKLAKPLLETNQVYAEIVRPLGGGKNEYVTFAPREVESGDYDTTLKARDRIRLYSTLAPKIASTAQAAPVAANGTAAPAPVAAPRTTAASTAPAAAGNGGIETDFGLYLEVVYTSGNIRYEGPYARTPTLKLSSVVTPDQILQDTNLDYAELTRRKADGSWEYLTFSPREVLGKTYDIPLRAMDSIHFVPVKYLPEKIDFDKFANAIAIQGPANFPGLYSFSTPKMLSEILTSDQLLSTTDIYYGEIERWQASGRIDYLTFSPLAVLKGYQDMRIYPRDIIRFVTAGDTGENHDFSKYPDTVLLAGSIRYPGRYAWYKGMKLSDIVHESDLLIDTEMSYAEVRRYSVTDDSIINFAPGQVIATKADVELHPRDTVIFYPKYSQKPISISGEVADPKVIPYYDQIELSSVLRSVTLLQDLMELKAEIKKTSGETTVVYLEDYLKRQPTTKILLSPGDAITIKALLPDEHLPAIVVRGEVVHPQTLAFTEGMRLSDALAAVGGYDSTAYPKGLVLIRKSVATAQQAQVDRLIAQYEAATSAGTSLPTISSSSSSSVSAFAVITNMHVDLAIQKAKLGNLKQLYKEGFGRIALDIPDSVEALADTSSDIRLERDDLIFVPKMPTYVLVSGEVSSQNVVLYKDGLTVRQAIAESGWILGEADLEHAYIVRASGRLDSTEGKGFLFFRPNILNYRLEPGDTVYVPTKSSKLSMTWAYLSDGFEIVGTILTTALTAKTLLGL